MNRDGFNDDDDFLNPEIEKKYSLNVEEEDSYPQEEMKAEELQEIKQKLSWSEKRELKKSERERQRIAEEQERELKKIQKEEQRRIEAQERIRQQVKLEEEKRIEKLEKKQAKELKILERRNRPVPAYKWFFFFILLAIPLINIFFLIYWGFFSDKVNKNIRSFILGSLLFTIVMAALLVAGYLNTDQLDPQVLQIFSNFFDESYDLFSRLFEQLKLFLYR